jgi:Cu(I)/Ag(I) efflux system membrane fusion protein
MNRLAFANILPFALVLALLCEACQSSSASRQEESTTGFVPALIHQPGTGELMELKLSQVPGMTLTRVKQIELSRVLEANGEISYDERQVATISSRVAGRIEQMMIARWDYVHKGQPILQLYSPDFMTAEAEYVEALETQKASSRPALGGNVELAAQMVAAARRKLELLGLERADIDTIRVPSTIRIVRAPISGNIVESKVTRGSQVNPGDPLFSVGILDPIWITAHIYEQDLARVHVGQQLEAVTTAYPNEIFRGVIARISPGINADTHTMELRCQVRNPGLKLKPQMLARVRIVTQPGYALVVPQKALVFETDAYYAFVQAAPDRFERRKVAISSWNEKGYARVVSGLNTGDEVVSDESVQVNALWHLAHGETS